MYRVEALTAGFEGRYRDGPRATLEAGRLQGELLILDPPLLRLFAVIQSSVSRSSDSAPRGSWSARPRTSAHLLAQDTGPVLTGQTTWNSCSLRKEGTYLAVLNPSALLLCCVYGEQRSCMEAARAASGASGLGRKPGRLTRRLLGCGQR